MAVSVQDQRMVQQLEESQVNVEKLALSVELGAVRDFIAVEVADKSLEFRAAIATEDQEELDLDQARQAYHESQRVAVDVFRTMHAALGTGVALKRARGEANAAVEQLNAYLSKMSASEFAALGRAEALANFERTYGYMDQFLPAELLPSIQALADDALAQMKAAERGLKTEDGEWIGAQAKLEQVRTETRTVYLAMRDIVSGLLRLAGMHQKLNQIAPPLTSVLNPGSRPLTPTDEPIIKPQPALDGPATDDSLV